MTNAVDQSGRVLLRQRMADGRLTSKQLNAAINALFAIGVALIPIDGVKGVSALGELGSEMSFAPLLAAALLSLYAATLPGPHPPRRMVWVAAGALGLIALSALANLPSIISAEFHDRGGPAKLATSGMVVGFGLALALAVETRPRAEFARSLVIAVAVSAAACIVYSMAEFAAHHGVRVPGFDPLDRFFHAGRDAAVNPWNGLVNRKIVYGWDNRLRSLGFEPPDFGNFTGFAWPWLVFALMIGRSGSRGLFLAIACLFTVLILAAQARTGWVMLAGNLGALLLLRGLFFNSTPSLCLAFARLLFPVACAGLLIALGIHQWTRFYSIVNHVVDSDSVSDLSRLASQTAAYRMALAHPLFGFGFGQYAFHLANFMPAWGFFSDEIKDALTYPAAPWPASYSIYARLAAETGVIGLGAWIALWTALMWKMVRDQRQRLANGRGVQAITYPLVMNCAGVLVSGVATDTFRTPMIWIALGLSVGHAFGREHRLEVPPNRCREGGQPAPSV